MGFLDPQISKLQDFLIDQNDSGQYENTSSQYPDELEVWACALELINSEGISENFFSFPVLPNGIQQNRATNVTVRKTMAGVVVNNNPTFVPFDIAINGNFGMRFRKVGQVSTNSSVNPNTFNVLSQEATGEQNGVFSSDFKTGFGNTKILENLLLKSQSLDEYGGSYMLLFYNLSFNSKFLVEPINFSFNASQERGRIWSYNIMFKAIAPASAVLSSTQLASSLQTLMSYKKQNKAYAKYSGDILVLMKMDLNTYSNLLPPVLQMLNKTSISFVNGVAQALNPWHEVNSKLKNPNTVQNVIIKSDRKVLSVL